MARANALFQAGDPEAAYKFYEKGWQISTARKDTLNAACFLAGIGNVHVFAHRYNEALRALQSAKEAALKANYLPLAVPVAVSRATLFRKIGDRASAEQAMREVTTMLPDDPPALLLVQAGNMSADHAGIDVAAPYYFAAIDRAIDERDFSAAALAWNQLGFLYMDGGELSKADDALSRAFALRLLHKNRRIGVSYVYLAMLRLKQGRGGEARMLLDRAWEVKHSEMPVAPFFLAYLRAQALARTGEPASALQEYEKAIELAHDWRAGMLPSDTFRVSAEVGLQEIFASFLATGLSVYRERPDMRLARRLFEASELNRATSLREKLSADKLLSPQYWSTLERFRVHAMSGAEQDTERLRLELAEEEAKLGFDAVWNKSHQKKESNTSDNALRDLQERLGETDALLSSHSSENGTFLWAVTRNSFEMHLLPPRSAIASETARFHSALQKESGWREQGRRLYDMLLSKLSATVKAKHSWLLSTGEVLYEVPFAALTTAGGDYLVERHALRFIPGAGLLGQRGTHHFRSSFTAFADPVYNGADPRWRGDSKNITRQLTRLPGTMLEAQLSARAWTGNVKVHSGLDVSRETVRNAFSEEPAVLHFATHVLQDKAAPDNVSVAMGLGRGGEIQLLTPSDIARWRGNVGLVVLSGCGSGTGKPLPGAGLIGLTRSWLLAGAQSVTATYWPIPDDGAHFFVKFYRELQSGGRLNLSAPRVADALRAAQVEAIHAGGTRAHPQTWGAFFVVGKD